MAVLGDAACANIVSDYILHSIVIDFGSTWGLHRLILGRLGGARRLPGAAWGQTDTTEYPGLPPWVPWDGS